MDRWRFGYVLELSLSGLMPEHDPPNYSVLFGADELRCLSSLRVTLYRPQVELLLDALERHRPPLTELVFFSGGYPAKFDERACNRLWAALPGLRHLAFSPYTDIAHINHPHIATITLLSEHSRSEWDFELVARSRLPALTRLNNRYWRCSANLLDSLADPSISSLLGRLEVFEFADLFEFLHYTEDWLEHDVFAHLRSSTKIIAVAPPEVGQTIRERLPNLNFEFISEGPDTAFGFPPSSKHRISLAWRCGQPRFEFGEHSEPEILLAGSLARMEPEQKRAATELIFTLEASEPGQSVVVDRASLLEMVRQPSTDWQPTDGVTAALEQHRACCSEVTFEVEAWSET
ncbi:MAG: hypothetical protein KC431_31925 [Myxococcales bacterium]|nr:hypothetical protein [Myxococcales bacterium]